MNPDRFGTFPVGPGAARHRAESRRARHASLKGRRGVWRSSSPWLHACRRHHEPRRFLRRVPGAIRPRAPEVGGPMGVLCSMRPPSNYEPRPGSVGFKNGASPPR
jgi:hypothetical protein